MSYYTPTIYQTLCKVLGLIFFKFLLKYMMIMTICLFPIKQIRPRKALNAAVIFY